MTVIKCGSGMKTIRLNKNGKARQPDAEPKGVAGCGTYAGAAGVRKRIGERFDEIKALFREAFASAPDDEREDAFFSCDCAVEACKDELFDKIDQFAGRN